MRLEPAFYGLSVRLNSRPQPNLEETAKYPRGATRKGAPCKHCGSTEKYLSSRRCVNFYNIPGHKDMVYVPPVLPPETYRECRDCGEVKSIGEFGWRSDTEKYRP